MKANELMIGDWIYNIHHMKNVQITPYDFFSHGHDANGTQYLRHKATLTTGRDWKPIPLTAEILERNGFEKKNDGIQDFLYVEMQYLPKTMTQPKRYIIGHYASAIIRQTCRNLHPFHS